MSISFQTFNHLPSVSSCLSRDTSQSKGKKKHAVAKHASIFPQAEEINGLPNSNRGSFSTNGVGIIEGLMVNSSMNFAKKVDSALQDDETDVLPLPFVLCTGPPLSNELISLARSSLSLFSGKSERVHIEHGLIVENLRRQRVSLENSGVHCIVMPCHLSHSWFDQIKEGCYVPFLHMGECVAKELKEANLRPIEAGSPLRIGVLATSATTVARVYQEKLEKQGFEVIMPDKATMEHIVIPSMEALSRDDFEGAQNLLRIALQLLLVKAVNKIIIASDELVELLPLDDPLWRRCIDPMDALARSTVKHARKTGRGK